MITQSLVVDGKTLCTGEPGTLGGLYKALTDASINQGSRTQAMASLEMRYRTSAGARLQSGSAVELRDGDETLLRGTVAPHGDLLRFETAVSTEHNMDVPDDWLVFTSTRPLLGHQVMENAEFLRGRFRAAVDPTDSLAERYIAENRKLNACVAVKCTRAELVAMALVDNKYAERYLEEYKGEELWDVLRPQINDLSTLDLGTVRFRRQQVHNGDLLQKSAQALSGEELQQGEAASQAAEPVPEPPTQEPEPAPEQRPSQAAPAAGARPSDASANLPRSQAMVGGEIGVNGYFYKGGQFLPSTDAEPGRWKIGKKWVSSSKELVEPGKFSPQPTPFSRSIFAMIQAWCVIEGGKLSLRKSIYDITGEAITPDTMTRPGVKGVLGKEEISFGDLIEAYNNGMRWFDVDPDALTVTTRESDTASVSASTPEADSDDEAGANAADEPVALDQQGGDHALTAQPESDLELMIKIAADSIEQLRRIDVFRVLDQVSDAERLEALAQYISSRRADLAEEVGECVAEIREVRSWGAPPAEQAPIQDPGYPGSMQAVLPRWADYSFRVSMDDEYGPSQASQEALDVAANGIAGTVTLETIVRPSGKLWHTIYLSMGAGRYTQHSLGSELPESIDDVVRQASEPAAPMDVVRFTPNASMVDGVAGTVTGLDRTSGGDYRIRILYLGEGFGGNDTLRVVPRDGSLEKLGTRNEDGSIEWLPGKNPDSGDSNPRFDRMIRIAADDVGRLRKSDVYRVLEQLQTPESLKALGEYIGARRPDLADEINEASAELHKANGWNAARQTEEQSEAESPSSKGEPNQLADEKHDQQREEQASAQAQEHTASPSNDRPTQTEPEAVKWFGSLEKAANYIEKKKLGDTHEVVEVGRRFEIHEKLSTSITTSAAGASEPAQAPTIEQPVRQVETADVLEPSALPAASAPAQIHLDDAVDETAAAAPARQQSSVLVHLDDMENFYKRLDALNQKAEKFGLDPVKVGAINAERYYRAYEYVGSEQDFLSTSYLKLKKGELPPNGEPVVVINRIDLDYPIIKLGDWQVVAKIEAFTLKENLIFTVTRDPQDNAKAEEHRNCGIGCQHCNTKRARNESFLLRSTDGEYKEVGSTCLEDFTGINPGAALFLAKMQELVNISAEFDPESGAGMGQQTVFSTEGYLARVAFCIEKGGWVSSARAREQGEPATYEDAVAVDAWLQNNQELAKEFFGSYERHKATARQAIAWYAEKEPTDSFDRNVKALLGEEFLSRDRRHLAFAAAAVPGYLRHARSLAAKKEGKPSEYIGSVKDKKAMTLAVDQVISSNGAYGIKYRINFLDEKGNRLTWKTHAPPRELLENNATGRPFNAKFTIKELEEYQGDKITAVTRLQFEGWCEPTLEELADEAPLGYIDINGTTEAFQRNGHREELSAVLLRAAEEIPNWDRQEPLALRDSDGLQVGSLAVREGIGYIIGYENKRDGRLALVFPLVESAGDLLRGIVNENLLTGKEKQEINIYGPNKGLIGVLHIGAPYRPQILGVTDEASVYTALAVAYTEGQGPRFYDTYTRIQREHPELAGAAEKAFTDMSTLLVSEPGIVGETARALQSKQLAGQGGTIGQVDNQGTDLRQSADARTDSQVVTSAESAASASDGQGVADLIDAANQRYLDWDQARKEKAAAYASEQFGEPYDPEAPFLPETFNITKAAEYLAIAWPDVVERHGQAGVKRALDSAAEGGELEYKREAAPSGVGRRDMPYQVFTRASVDKLAAMLRSASVQKLQDEKREAEPQRISPTPTHGASQAQAPAGMFETYAEAHQWISNRAKELGLDSRAYTATDEYRDLYPQIDALYKTEVAKANQARMARLAEAGLEVGDRVSTVVDSFGTSQAYTGTVFIKGETPYVRLDSSITVSKGGRLRETSEVKWDERWREYEPPAPDTIPMGLGDMDELVVDGKGIEEDAVPLQRANRGIRLG